MAGAFVAHILLHTVLLVMVVPLLSRADDPPSEDSYRSCAESNAASFFTANPIYCLRSVHVYKHKVPCDFCIVGKEHMIRKSEEIGQYFEDQKAETEDFKKFESMTLLSARKEIFNFARDTSHMLGKRLTSSADSDPSSPKSSTSPRSMTPPSETSLACTPARQTPPRPPQSHPSPKCRNLRRPRWTWMPTTRPWQRPC